MTVEDLLLKDLIENPEDDTPRLVYADWLEEHGQPERAELIRVQINLVKPREEARRHELERREKELLDEHRTAWSGSFRDITDRCVFRRGFIEELILSVPTFFSVAERLFDLAPVRLVGFAEHDNWVERGFVRPGVGIARQGQSLALNCCLHPCNDEEEDPTHIVFRTCTLPGLAPRIASLEITGPRDDTYATNGVRWWNLEPLARGNGTFEHLRLFSVEGAGEDRDLGDFTIISDGGYDENEIVARLLDRMPRLERLAVPSAPGPAFFNRSIHPLRQLAVAAGFDAHSFIQNLADSTCFASLETLDYMEDYESRRTPLAHYRQLFESANLPNLRHLILRNPNLSVKDISALRKAPLGRQLESFKVYSTPASGMA
jgi:uncharacterized protein (TIGR02996 family)